jgi:hypothetical protein
MKRGSGWFVCRFREDERMNSHGSTNIDHQLVSRVFRIPWFSHCGEPILDRTQDVDAIKFVASIDEALQYALSPEWESVTHEAQGRLTEFLSKKFASDYWMYWNKLVCEAKDCIADKIVDRLIAAESPLSADERIVDCVKWDILHALMEMSFFRCRPPLFFIQLLNVYERGRFPCGWSGEWPAGLLVAY